MKLTGADHLRDWMDRRGFTSMEAAQYLQVDPGYISNFLHRKRTPGLMMACRIERRTGIPVEVWLSRAEPGVSAYLHQRAEQLGWDSAVVQVQEG